MHWEEAFLGNGKPGTRPAPAFTRLPTLDNAEGYVADPGLRDAVNVAILLGQPLLITGEPGTGKTLLAKRLAYELGHGEPLVFIARTTSTANELFYTYDALRRFLDVQTQDKRAEDPSRYVTYQALGLAILLALPREMADPFLPERYRGKGPIRSVVLIDEIDKAPRDLPNDILNEVERMEFAVKETNKETERRFPDFEEVEEELYLKNGSREQARAQVDEYRATFARNRPILILTSNDEQKLPDAFLRRCVYYHIAFPDPGTLEGKATLRTIVANRLGDHLKEGFGADSYLDTILTMFGEIRVQLEEKKPATAELIAWVRMREKKGLTLDRLRSLDDGSVKDLKSTFTVLAKSRLDRMTVEQYVDRLTADRAGAGRTPSPAGGG